MRRLVAAMLVMVGSHVMAAETKPGAPAQAAAVEKREKEFTVENKYLIMPIQNNGKGEGRGGDKRKTLMLYIDGKAVRQYNMRLAPSAELADWYAFFTIGNYKGKKARVEATATAAGFALIKQSDTVPGEENFYKEPHRPQFHFTQKVGWSNDVNGLVYQDGKWHFFFQYNPVEVLWGNMTWGHAVSEDLLHWEQRASALFPGCMAKGACWSGSATLDKKNTAGWGENAMVALFTDIGNGEAVAYSIDKGETFTYYEGNPVVKHDGRDPKIIWYAYGKQDKPLNDKAQDLGGHWVMAVFQSGGVAFYTSTNLKDWTEQSHLPGYFECIDLIKLPVDGDVNNTRWVVYGADAKYAVGQFDGSKFTPEHKGKYQVHFGAYYAAQTFDNSPDGRRIQIGWVQVAAPGPYNQHFSFPHCLTLHKTGDGIRMFAAPIKEIETLRAKTNKAEPRKMTANKPVNLPVGSDLLDIRLTVEVGSAETIELNVPGSTIKYDAQAKTLEFAGLSGDAKKDKGVPLAPVDGRIKLQVLVDRSVMEIAGNDGRVYISGAGPGNKVDVNKISVTATGGDAKLVEFEAHELNSIW